KRAQLLLPCAHLLLGFQPALLRAGARGENFEQRNQARLRGQRFGVEHREMAYYRAVRVEQRHTQVTDRIERLQDGVVWIKIDDAVGNVQKALAVNDGFTGCAVDPGLVTVEVCAVEPEGVGSELAG